MEFPYGEATILLLTLVTWTQRHPARRLYLSLCLAWLVGRIVDSLMGGGVPWHLNYARLAVILVFWWWAWQKAERRFSALLLTLLSLVLLDLFLVNEPGILLYDQWISVSLCFLIAWLASASYWGMAAAVAGSVFINQALIPFVFGGIVRYVDLPDAFLWNFGVVSLMIFGFIKSEALSLFEVRGSRYEGVKLEGIEQRAEIEVQEPRFEVQICDKSEN
ncbi:MAG: hypothetical protein WA131_02975 [Desulfitobacteriaceae bacterium]